MNRLNGIRVAVGVIGAGVILLILAAALRGKYEYMVPPILAIGSICSLFGLPVLIFLLHGDMEIWHNLDTRITLNQEADKTIKDIELYQEALKRVALRSRGISPEAVNKKIEELEKDGWKSLTR